LGKSGHFDVNSVARKYAGKDAKPKEVQAYIDGWSHWSNGALRPDTVIHITNDQELLVFAKAVFAHEAAAVSPVHDDQIIFGFQLERGSIAEIAEATMVEFSGIVGRGWELLVCRQEVQYFKNEKRTYGMYQVYRDRIPINDLVGFMCECRGPGDNKNKRSRKRIEEGRYALLTQFGRRYQTIGYSNDSGFPMPGLRLGGTGNRDAILIHPGHPPNLYLTSIGCLNPTGPLASNQRMDFCDSRKRVIALIDNLRKFAPAAFKHEVNTRISDAHIVVVGEP
jgi:hypothetical protein